MFFHRRNSTVFSGKFFHRMEHTVFGGKFSKNCPISVLVCIDLYQ